jgi:hypothetical protein
MIKNLQAVTNLFFSPNSHSSNCLSSWVNHFENNRIYYRSLHDADPTFLTQVLYAIDRALQFHWLSCSENSDRRSVNIKILQIQDLQNNIERHNFDYIIPKTLSDKFHSNDEDNKSTKSNDLKSNKTKREKELEKEKFKKQHVDETLHKQWHLKQNENYSDLFWKNTDKCPKTKNGTLICMKYFIKGHCTKSCNRAHRLSKEDEKSFDELVAKCCSSDFQQRAEEPQVP